jgi:hypothetical protein
VTPARQIVPQQPIKPPANTRVGTVAMAIATGDGLVRSFTPKPQQRPSFNCTGTDAAYAQAAGLLKGLRDPYVMSSLRAKVKSPSLEPQNRLWIANVLVSRGDFQSLNYVKPLLLDPPNESEFIDPAVRALARTIQSVAGSSDLDRTQQKQRIEILTALLRSKLVAVRRAAVVALGREVYQPDPAHPSDEFLRTILEPIAKAGLYDPDLEVRWETISALGRAKQVLYKPWSYQIEFEKNQAEGVDFWRRMVGIRALHIP